MKRLIYAEDAVKEIDEWLEVVGDVVIGKHLSYYGELLGCIKDAPTIEVVPVVHGEWESELGLFFPVYRCSECNCATALGKTNFCPNCGADMRGEK